MGCVRVPNFVSGREREREREYEVTTMSKDASRKTDISMLLIFPSRIEGRMY